MIDLAKKQKYAISFSFLWGRFTLLAFRHKKDRLMTVLKRKREDSLKKQERKTKLESKRQTVYEKLLKDQKDHENDVYKKYRRDLVMSEQKAHKKSVEIKQKNLEDFHKYNE